MGLAIRCPGHTVSPSDPRATNTSLDIHLVDGTGDIDGTDQGSKLERCQEIIDYRFQDQSLLLSALTHASGASHRLASNERLEFLGDAVLGLTVCQWLYEDYPEYNEGDLTKIKSACEQAFLWQGSLCSGLDRC